MTDSNPWDVDDDDAHEDDRTPAPESKNFAELRKAYNRRDKEAKQYEAELEELRAFREQVVTERKTAAITSAFTEAEVDPKFAKFFQTDNPEVEVESLSPDKVREWAAGYGLASVETGEAVSAPPKDEGYKPVVTGTQAPLATLTMEDVDQLLRQGDTAAVEKAFREGRVQKEQPSWLTLAEIQQREAGRAAE